MQAALVVGESGYSRLPGCR